MSKERNINRIKAFIAHALNEVPKEEILKAVNEALDTQHNYSSSW